MIKLILLSDVSDLGQKGEIVEVKPGYARNFLIPRKLAKMATDEEIEKLEQKQEEEKAKKEAEFSEKKSLAEQLSGTTLEFEKKQTGKGKIFGSVDGKAIAKELAKKTNLKLKSADIKLEKPLKEIGEHKVSIKLAKDIKVDIKVLIRGKNVKKSSK